MCVPSGELPEKYLFINKIRTIMTFNRFLTAILLISALAVACRQKAKPEPGQTPPVAFANATDFVCDMKVTPEFEDTCHYQGKVYAFCSESCKETFLEDPGKYLNGQ